MHRFDRYRYCLPIRREPQNGQKIWTKPWLTDFKYKGLEDRLIFLTPTPPPPPPPPCHTPPPPPTNPPHPNFPYPSLHPFHKTMKRMTCKWNLLLLLPHCASLTKIQWKTSKPICNRFTRLPKAQNRINLSKQKRKRKRNEKKKKKKKKKGRKEIIWGWAKNPH